MRLPQLRMDSGMAQINISVTPSRQTIRQPKAQMHLEQPPAKLAIRTTPGRLTIDQSRAWAAMDIKHIFQRIKENAAEGHRDAMQGIARRAAEGDELMKIENGGNPIASQAVRKSKILNYQYNYALVPPPFSVQMHYQPGTVKIEAEPQRVINHTVSRMPIIDYQRGQVNISMKQYASLEFEAVNVEV